MFLCFKSCVVVGGVVGLIVLGKPHPTPPIVGLDESGKGERGSKTFQKAHGGVSVDDSEPADTWRFTHL